MAAQTQDALTQLSDALAARTAAAAGLVASIHAPRSRPHSGIIWCADVIVASDQVLPKIETPEIVFADGRRIPATIAGRDPGTNVAALRLETPVQANLPAMAEPRLGGLVLAVGADPNGALTVRLGLVHSLGPAWHSLAGGHIDHRITLDLRIAHAEEGGPVLDAAGSLLGMSTCGPGGRGIVIPTATIARVLDPLLVAGRIERGWLGLALHPVALPDVTQSQAGQQRGLMVMRVAADGPCAKAGVLVGDILVAVDGAPASRPLEIARRFGPDSIGKQVTLQIIRSGARQTVTPMITPRPQG